MALSASVLTVLAVLAGCGGGGASRSAPTTLIVTRNFGAQPILQLGVGQRGIGLSVERLLADVARVRVNRGSVVSIDGLGSAPRSGSSFRPRLAWSFYVNGIAGTDRATATTVHAGDQVWWDLHEASASRSTPAVVGAFPEPFLHGIDGRRLPTRIECADPAGAACGVVSARLRAIGVAGFRAALGPGNDQNTLRVLVGPWKAVRADPAAIQIVSGPAASGVYARFSADGSSLSLLDGAGAGVRTLGAGAGLVAIVRFHASAPVWLVTGTDGTGVLAAAVKLDALDLRDRYALAVGPLGEVPLPA